MLYGFLRVWGIRYSGVWSLFLRCSVLGDGDEWLFLFFFDCIDVAGLKHGPKHQVNENFSNLSNPTHKHWRPLPAFLSPSSEPSNAGESFSRTNSARQKFADELHHLISVLNVGKMAGVLHRHPFHLGERPEERFDAYVLSFVLLAVVNQRRHFDPLELLQHAPVPQRARDGQLRGSVPAAFAQSKRERKRVRGSAMVLLIFKGGYLKATVFTGKRREQQTLTSSHTPPGSRSTTSRRPLPPLPARA